MSHEIKELCLSLYNIGLHSEIDACSPFCDTHRYKIHMHKWVVQSFQILCAASSFCPMRLWISGAICWASFSSSLSACTTWPRSFRPSAPPERTTSSTPSNSSASRCRTRFFFSLLHLWQVQMSGLDVYLLFWLIGGFSSLILLFNVCMCKILFNSSVILYPLIESYMFTLRCQETTVRFNIVRHISCH